MKLGNILIFGDSYSTFEGWIPDGYAIYYTKNRKDEPIVYDVKNTWWKRLIDATEATLVQNNSWSGSTIGYTGYNASDNSHSSSFIYRFEKHLSEGFFEKNKIDTLFVFGGTNDSWCNAPLGEFRLGKSEESELFSVLPAIGHFATRLKEALPNTRIVFIGNCGIKEVVTDALARACEHYGFKYIALNNIDKISSHPTELGMAQICEQILASI